MPRNPHKTRCSVPGCQAWAIRGSDPPICSPHRSKVNPESVVGASPESLARASPEPSEGASSESVRGVGAPTGNQNRLTHGFYATVLCRDELDDLAAYAGDTTVDAEIGIVRVALRRILGMLLTGVTPGPNPRPLDVHDYARFIGLAFQGAGAVSRLLRTRQALGGEQNDEFRKFMDEVLDQASAELGIDL